MDVLREAVGEAGSGQRTGVTERMTASIDNLVGALELGREFVDAWAQRATNSDLEDVASHALMRLRSQIRAVVALARTEGVDGTDIEVQARTLIEIGIVGAWIGRDAARAKQFRDYGIGELTRWMHRFVDAMNGRPGANKPPKNVAKIPALRILAMEAGAWYANTYAMSYPRLSAALHGLDAPFRSYQPGEIASQNALEDAVVGVIAILTWTSAVLDVPAGQTIESMALLAGMS